MTTPDSNTTNCPVLQGPENYQIWKLRIRAKLRREKVYGVADGSEPKLAIAATSTAPLTGDSWELRDAKAHGIITEHICDRILLEVHSENTSKKLLDRITELHEKTNVGINAFYTYVELMNMRWDNASPLDTHIAAIRSANHRLTAMEKGIDDEFLAFLLLHSLPSDTMWETFKSSVLNSLVSDAKLSFAAVESRLTAEATRLSSNTTPTNLESALKAQKGDRSKHCSLHGDCSHTTTECRTLRNREKEKKGEKAKAKRKRRSKREKAHKAEETTDCSDSSSTHSCPSDSSDNEHANIANVRTPRSLKNRIFAYFASEPTLTKRDVLIDSGASAHMVPHRGWFTPGSYRPIRPPRIVRFGDDSSVKAIGVGSVHFTSRVHGKTYDIFLSDVLLVPSFSMSLVSVNKLDRAGLSVQFKHQACHIKRDGTTVMKASHKRGLYHLNVIPTAHPEHANLSIDINVLHRRMGHAGTGKLKRMVHQGQLRDIETITGNFEFCEPCALGKTRKLPFKPSMHKNARRPLQIIHSDVGGPVTPASQSGHRYWITFICEYSRFPWVYFMTRKAEAQTVYNQWKKDVQTFFNEEISQVHFSRNFVDFLRTDGGGEYCSNDFEKQLRAEGVIHETTAADTPESNGLAERMNLSLANKATTMLIESNLPKLFWAEAMLTACYLIGRSPASGIHGKSPYERLFKRKVDCTFFRPFGCVAYALIPKEKRIGKFGKKGRKSIMLGYTLGKKAYKLLDTETQKVFHSRHVIFDEKGALPLNLQRQEDESGDKWEDMLHQSKPRSAAENGVVTYRQPMKHRTMIVGGIPEQNQTAEAVGEQASQGRDAPGSRPLDTAPDHETVHNLCPQPVAQPEGVRRSAREPRRADRNRDYERAREAHERRLLERRQPRNTTPPSSIQPGDDPDHDEIHFVGVANTGPKKTQVPSTLKEALSGTDAKLWRPALNEELQSLADNDVYDIVPVPKGVTPITSKPVMRVKLDKNGNIERHKLRIVARGFTQREGVDYQEVFAPVANLESIRIIIALAAKYDLELDQMDVATAYLNGKLEEEIYLQPPDGVPIPSGCCWRLKRSLYGLKQAGRTWNRTLDAKLSDIGFAKLNAETCLYVFQGNKGDICFLVVYVDDLLLATSTRRFMEEIKTKLSASFKMRDLGPASYVLGIEIRRDRKLRTISLTQRQYVDSVLERCGMGECKPAWTPMKANTKISADEAAGNDVTAELEIGGKTISYRSVVGSLMYAMQGTRPDIAFLVGVLGRHSESPKPHHWELVKRGLRYLKATRDMELRFDGSDVSVDMSFHGYTDADWSGDPETSRSTSGYVFISNRGAIGWASKRQSMVALSTTESEYIGLSNAGQHIAWLRTFFAELGHAQKGPTILSCDNQAAIILSKDAQYRARTKHIQRKYHYFRDDLVATGEVIVRYVPTADMVADILTKGLGHEKHWKFVRAMGLRLRSSGSDENRGT
jgi:Reverse transcriptase (RNA-dependent DNA polymerase)/Pol polyprotein, beta-barrel domain/gag-polypeptide of LTR copia-type/Integrase core domain/GAG-pre-integrase domain